MRKRQIIEGTVIRRDFPNKGIVSDLIKVSADDAVENEKMEGNCVIKNTLPGQRVRGIVTKSGKNRLEARLLEVLEEAPDAIESPCPHFGICGSCHYLSMTYEQELALKEEQVKKLLSDAFKKQETEPVWDGIKKSPIRFEYRNKMEFSFGDEVKDGPLSLGMHKRGSMHDIVTVKGCQIIDADYRKILTCVLDYFASMYTPLSNNEVCEKNISDDNSDVVEKNDLTTNNIVSQKYDQKIITGKETVTFYHTMQKKGYLRHLLVRKARKTGQILVDLITTTQEEHDLNPLKDALLSLDLDGEIVGFLHTKNDSLSDAVVDQGTDIIYGQDHFTEELLGLKFDITPFSFFQTNSLSAEVLYDTVRDYVREGMKEQGRDKAHILYDLYCGTGTISQLMSPVADKVIGVEIIEEAVEAAKINAKRNNVDNCEFIAGDVLKVLDEIEEKPDYIILDPPRDGIHPKALRKIIDYGVDRMVYVSCKPTSLQRDLVELQAAGYRIERACAVNQFPCTVHVETIVLLTKTNA
ncbi:class I SAM-dependent RNA methyltransferase [Butyrivibrio sp. TB]|uniref:class I SAM-dependent RNA methyltransferase n=1 Tax=Butyrivibrio sp. TB TaxID=1520809 RepID=UPI0008AEC4C9|nr:class I SAM-dependent RNA methyltransferase [Butyrivibrio sp. TB]SEQ42738.1 23S rRNA (uracil-5-)-methyltransferase RumA [Butyrivibrio sp. TB]